MVTHRDQNDVRAEEISMLRQYGTERKEFRDVLESRQTDVNIDLHKPRRQGFYTIREYFKIYYGTNYAVITYSNEKTKKDDTVITMADYEADAFVRAADSVDENLVSINVEINTDRNILPDFEMDL